MIKRISLRLEEEDYKLLDQQAKLYGVNKNEFIRILLRKNMIGDIKELNRNLIDIYKLNIGMANNLNQIARKCNYNVSNFMEIKKELDDLWQSLKR